MVRDEEQVVELLEVVLVVEQMEEELERLSQAQYIPSIFSLFKISLSVPAASEVLHLVQLSISIVEIRQVMM